MLRELGLVEQRYEAVREVLNEGASVTDWLVATGSANLIHGVAVARRD